jgi:hypothetical protein
MVAGSAECALANFPQKTAQGLFAAHHFDNSHAGETVLQIPIEPLGSERDFHLASSFFVPTFVPKVGINSTSGVINL